MQKSILSFIRVNESTSPGLQAIQLYGISAISKAYMSQTNMMNIRQEMDYSIGQMEFSIINLIRSTISSGRRCKNIWFSRNADWVKWPRIIYLFFFNDQSTLFCHFLHDKMHNYVLEKIIGIKSSVVLKCWKIDGHFSLAKYWKYETYWWKLHILHILNF